METMVPALGAWDKGDGVWSGWLPNPNLLKLAVSFLARHFHTSEGPLVNGFYFKTFYNC